MNTLDLETKINTILEDCLYLVALFKNLEADKTSLFTKIETFTFITFLYYLQY